MNIPEIILKDDEELINFYEELRKENKRKEEEEIKKNIIEMTIKQYIKKININEHDFNCTVHSPDKNLILHFCSICYEKNKYLFY
jgi:hypothetical protein